MNSVKLLELSLLQEQRAGKGAGEKAAVETAEVKQNLESAEKTKTALEAKLAEAYQEVCVCVSQVLHMHCRVYWRPTIGEGLVVDLYSNGYFETLPHGVSLFTSGVLGFHCA